MFPHDLEAPAHAPGLSFALFGAGQDFAVQDQFKRICRRLRHKPRKPPLARINPGSPAPAIGAGTPAGLTTTDWVSMSNVPSASPLPKKSNELLWLLPGL